MLLCRARSIFPPYAIARRMSSAPAAKHKFVVFAPDRTDAGCLERRLRVRPTHLAGAATMWDAGSMKLGGAMLTPESLTTGEKTMVGSVLIIEAESLAAARAVVEADVYYTADVWDPEKLVIAPFVAAHM
ncbi:hypothetical protein HWV62_16144 [Athelia sp. TMB]|nr:hypothetical protein HWV62_16144 [Athelia sp. TMB]